MSVLDGFNEYEREENQKLVSHFSDTALLRARMFFMAHGSHERRLPWVVLRDMKFLSEVLRDNSPDNDKELLKSKSSAVFLFHDVEQDLVNGICAQGSSCPVFHEIVDNFDKLGDFCENFFAENNPVLDPALKEVPLGVLRDSFYRIFDLMSFAPGVIYPALSQILKLYNAEGTKAEHIEKSSTHLHALCDLYERMPEDERAGFPPEVLVHLSEPETTMETVEA